MCVCSMCDTLGLVSCVCVLKVEGWHLVIIKTVNLFRLISDVISGEASGEFLFMVRWMQTTLFVLMTLR